MSRYCNQILSIALFMSTTLLFAGFGGKSDNTQPAANAAQEQRQAAQGSENEELSFAKSLYENNDCVIAFQIFKKYADQGNVEAQAWLGRCYMNGIGTQIDTKKAYVYFSKAAQKNNPWGLNGLGVCTQHGYGTPVNLQAAMELYMKAAAMNHPLAIINIAMTYGNKNGGFYDEKKADTYFKKAIELNAPTAKPRYAAFLFYAHRYTEAVPLLQDSLDTWQSMMIMAQCYENGWGVPVNISKAVELATQCYRRFGPEEWNANLCFAAGLEEVGINGNTETAKNRIKLAALQGHAEAQYAHALILYDANDTENALAYMMKSADNGYDEAMLNAGKRLMKQKDYPKAIKYLMLASLHRRTRAQAIENLSNIYHYELKIPLTGEFWDVKGAALGLDFCRNELAIKEYYTKGDEHFARAAALFAMGRANENEFAISWLNDILADDYNRLRDLADHKNANALLALGLVGCLDGKDHPNLPIGLELLEESAKLNNGDACQLLGNIYNNGVLVPKDLKKAYAWYLKGAELGNTPSAQSAGKMLYYDEAFKDTKLEEYKKVFDIAMKLEVLDLAYEYGSIMEHLAKDMKKAEELYRLAAKYEDGRAMIRLHEMLSEKNPDEAVDFLNKAIGLHDFEAEVIMGDIQRQVLKAPRKAYIHYMQANIYGDSVTAPYKLAECWLNGYGCEVNLNCFWNSAEDAYKNGCADVCYLLGSVYRDGKICAKDLTKAKEYFEEGVKRGSEKCKIAMKEM